MGGGGTHERERYRSTSRVVNVCRSKASGEILCFMSWFGLWSLAFLADLPLFPVILLYAGGTGSQVLFDTLREGVWWNAPFMALLQCSLHPHLSATTQENTWAKPRKAMKIYKFFHTSQRQKYHCWNLKKTAAVARETSPLLQGGGGLLWGTMGK